MPDLLFVRHGESEDNLKGTIQGPLNNSGLTKKGLSDARRTAKYLSERETGISRIYSSGARRADETAREISGALDIPVETEPLLREFDPGILSGMTKEEAGRSAPKALEEYLKRGDLDGIPGAETGDKLQARSILFLSRYLDSEKDSRDVAVSHAGFIRCASNTGRNRPRSSPLSTPNGGVEVVQDPWAAIEHSRLHLAKASDAYKVVTPDSKYVLKLVSGRGREYFEEQAEIHALLEETGRTQRMLSWADGAQVLEYLEGTHKYGPLSREDSLEVIACAYDVQKALSKKGSRGTQNDLRGKLEGSLKNLPSESFSAGEIRRLLDDSAFSQALSGPLVPVDYDWHRSNILFNGGTALKIDPSIVYAPAEFQPASVILSSFLLEQPDADAPSLAKLWPENVSPERLAPLLKARALIGMSFFERPDVPKTAENSEILSRYVSAFSGIGNYGKS